MPPTTRPSKASKKRSRYVCQQCGHEEPRWTGRCSACQTWSSLVEELPVAAAGRRADTARVVAEPAPLGEVASAGPAGRLASGIEELDRVLGGGLVPGSAVLVGGDPGIGKSTLALQLAAAIAATGQPTLYVAGEEAPAQVRARAERIGVEADRLMVLAATDTGSVAAAMERMRPALTIIDSVQTLHSPRVDSAPGSVTQLREATAEILVTAREADAACLFIGHVTKDGSLAGPRVLEHMVDTVLYFEGDKDHVYRILRAVKNRFGATGEIGVFEMRADGLAEVDNPSAAFMGSTGDARAGSAVTAAMEGTRPMLVEVQSLVVASNPGSARRTTLGIEHGRVSMLAAVLERHLGMGLRDHDLFVATGGGVRIEEPAADLAVMAAIASSRFDLPVAPGTVLIGEAGLGGELRAVSQLGPRLAEAARLGFTRAVVPAAGHDRDQDGKGLEVVGAGDVAAAWEAVRSR
ncbi:MAG: DNA repair protein RadA [Deltaproteobacteria bacterium]